LPTILDFDVTGVNQDLVKGFFDAAAPVILLQ
jgi:hypothetical protein